MVDFDFVVVVEKKSFYGEHRQFHHACVWCWHLRPRGLAMHLKQMMDGTYLHKMVNRLMSLR